MVFAVHHDVILDVIEDCDNVNIGLKVTFMVIALISSSPGKAFSSPFSVIICQVPAMLISITQCHYCRQGSINHAANP